MGFPATFLCTTLKVSWHKKYHQTGHCEITSQWHYRPIYYIFHYQNLARQPREQHRYNTNGHHWFWPHVAERRTYDKGVILGQLPKKASETQQEVIMTDSYFTLTRAIPTEKISSTHLATLRQYFSTIGYCRIESWIMNWPTAHGLCPNSSERYGFSYGLKSWRPLSVIRKLTVKSSDIPIH